MHHSVCGTSAFPAETNLAYAPPSLLNAKQIHKDNIGKKLRIN